MAKKVLVVDDAPMLQERLCCLIGRVAGVEMVGVAGDVPQALLAFERLRPDVVVLDLQMPGGTGIDVLEKIKKDRPGTVVIILTNCPLPQLKKKSTEAGADFFFDKTGEFERVAEVLKELASRE
jgi:DNA-binding NarL/FixJ family response regulator